MGMRGLDVGLVAQTTCFELAHCGMSKKRWQFLMSWQPDTELCRQE